MTGKVKIIIGGVTLLAVVIFAMCRWYFPQYSVSLANFAKPKEMQSATKIDRKEIPVQKIVALDKKTASKKLKLPEEIATDDRKQITATAEIPPYDGKTDVIAVFNTETRETEINARQRPRSFFELINNGAIGARYGYAIGTEADNNMGGDVYARWDILRTGNVVSGVYGELNSSGECKAMITVEYRWQRGNR
ncbi:MAG: hypothetical protein LLG40_11265 [Deltaproteobacteria bacterium]|nr:hypothetical protein [Deltaproteobacteria bacterium]